MRSSNALRFVKMQAAGNDFILTTSEWVASTGSKASLFEIARSICDRHYGLGADGFICLHEEESAYVQGDMSLSVAMTSETASLERAEKMQEPKTPSLEMLFFNPDGTHSRMCGNGARCFARFAKSLGWETHLHFTVNQKSYRTLMSEDRPEEVTLFFDEPVDVHSFHLDEWLHHGAIPCAELGRLGIHLHAAFRVQPGTDHLVLILDSGTSLLRLPPAADSADSEVPSDSAVHSDSAFREQLRQLAASLRSDSAFSPSGINVNFARKTGSDQIELLTFERGVEGFTESCGTGTIATALAFHVELSTRENHDQLTILDTINSKYLDIDTDGGRLRVACDVVNGSGYTRFDSISLTGPAQFIAEGSFILPV